MNLERCLNMNDTEIKLLTLLNSFGDIIELDYNFTVDSVIRDLQKGHWSEGTHGKRGMNLTGPEKDIGLQDHKRHEIDQEYNQNLLNSQELTEFFDRWEAIARCRAAHMNAGSYFKMHRDAHKFNPQIRIFIPLNKTDVHEWNFIYDDRRVTFKAGKPYVLNTRKQHGSFAFEDDIYHVLMSLRLTENNLKEIMQMVPNRKEF